MFATAKKKLVIVTVSNEICIPQTYKPVRSPQSKTNRSNSASNWNRRVLSGANVGGNTRFGRDFPVYCAFYITDLRYCWLTCENK